MPLRHPTSHDRAPFREDGHGPATPVPDPFVHHVGLFVCRSDGLRLITLDGPMPYEPSPALRVRPAEGGIWDS
jgi:hypothetical protein